MGIPESATLVLPAEPEAISVDELRSELQQCVSRLVERWPDSPGTHRTAAVLHQFLMHREPAAEHWQKCVELDPDDRDARLWLAKTQLSQGEDAKAAKTLRDAAEAGFRSPEFTHHLALALQRLGQLEESAETAGQGARDFPHSAEIWIALGQAQFQLGHLDEAKDSYETAIRCNPDLSAAQLGLLNVYTRLGRQEEAAVYRRKIEEAEEKRERERRPYEEEYEESLRHVAATVLAGAAAEYDARGDSAEAERLCRRAYEIDPVSPPPYRQLANMYHRQGRLHEALVVQRRLVEVEPDNVVNYLNLGGLSWMLGQLAEAEAALQEARRRHPQDARIHQALAAMHEERRRMTDARQADPGLQTIQPITRASP